MKTALYSMTLFSMMLSALLAMAFYTLSERKFLGYMQYRKGPNKPSILALTIPMADAAKLFSKENKNTLSINNKYYFITPTMMIFLALLLWPVIPNFNMLFFMKFNILYFMCITSVMIYTTFMAGWSSNSKWGLLGALRGIAQTISYEVSLSLILICFITHTLTMNSSTIFWNQYTWTMVMLIPLSLSWSISILAETHRTPFDFAEGESELVSGFNVEYKSSMFALIFMAEYMNILLMSLLTISIMTKNYTNTELMVKSTIFSLMFIWTRGALPRMRYDKLMDMLWKKILPMSLMMMFMVIPLITLMK